jgi:multimeric flavodoxin WrbA
MYVFKRKVGAAVVAVRRAGSIHAFNSINHFFLINQMIIPAPATGMGMGHGAGDVEHDEEGIMIMKTLGQARLLKQIHE